MAVQIVGAVAGIVIAVAGFLGLWIPPLKNLTDQSMFRLFPNQIPDMYTLINMRAMNRISAELYEPTMRKLGFNKFWAQILEKYAQQFLGLGDYLTLFRRGEIDEGIYYRHASELGIDEETARLYVKASEYFPSASDLVRFAVREVYTPSIADKYGLFDDLPEKFISESRKAGLPTNQAENYWASHWELPSVSMGFEMLHRRVITFDDLQELLRALDVMPYWREKLTQISYNPLTRVDVRRMYGMGVIDVEGVYNAYLDIGYNDKNAKLMTEFTVKYENDEVNGLTRATIVNAYKNDIISKDSLIDYLRAFRYTDDVIAFYVDVADFEKTEEYISTYSNQLVEGWKEGSLTEEEVRNLLMKEDLPSTYINSIIAKLKRQKTAKQKVVSNETLDRWLRSGIIDENYYTKQMRKIGYTDLDIELYLTEVNLTWDTKGRKYLKTDVYDRWVKEEIISVDRYIETMTNMGISYDDIMTRLSELEVI